MSASFCGAVLLIVDEDREMTDIRTARVLTSLTCLLIISWSNAFSKIFLSFKHAAATGAPVVTMILFFVSIFALATRDMFGDTLIDDYTGDPYFDTFSNSIATCFRMCFDWHAIM